MARLANTIEAILYLKARSLTIGQIAEYASCDRDTAEEGLIELMGDYAHREGALEIAETEEGYCLQLKQPFRPLLDQLIPLDIGVGALRTLAAVALRGPITQPDLVELRGSGVYQHVPDLVELGFLRKRRQSDGRSFWLQVTEKFYQRFEIDKLPEIAVPKSFAGRNSSAGEADDSSDDQDLPDESQLSVEEASLSESPRSESVEAELAETEPVETEPAETEPAETKPVETESVEAEPAETESVETMPVADVDVLETAMSNASSDVVETRSDVTLPAQNALAEERAAIVPSSQAADPSEG